MRISDAEWRVMRIVWQHQAVTAAEVITEVTPETGWNHRTVRTLLSRLVDKGALSTEEKNHRYIYRPKVKQSKCVRQEAKSFVEKVFDGDAAELLLHFVRHEQISPEQVEQLKNLLEQKGEDKN